VAQKKMGKIILKIILWIQVLKFTMIQMTQAMGRENAAFILKIKLREIKGAECLI
jgi:hypothetical protein